MSPHGLVLKQQPGKYHLIHNLSYLEDRHSVNGFIPRDPCQESFDQVIQGLQRGRGAELDKADKVRFPYYTHTSRLPPFYLFPGSMQGHHYYDTCLPMGCSESCRIYESLSSALQWLFTAKFALPYVSHVLDDFIPVGKPHSG